VAVRRSLRKCVLVPYGMHVYVDIIFSSYSARYVDITSVFLKFTTRLSEVSQIIFQLGKEK